MKDFTNLYEARAAKVADPEAAMLTDYLKNYFAEKHHNKIVSSLVHPIDKECYKKIKKYYSEVPTEDKKGTKWFTVIPDENADFEPFLVSIKNMTWRVPTDKELYGKTSSAKGKELIKICEFCSNSVGEPFSTATECNEKVMRQTEAYQLCYILKEYAKVKKAGSTGWYTLTLFNFLHHSEVSESQVLNVISINPQTKQYAWGVRSDIPANNIMDMYLYSMISTRLVDGARYNMYSKDQGPMFMWGAVYNYMTKIFKKAAPSKMKKKDKNWVEFGLADWGKLRTTSKERFFINIKTLEYVSMEDMSKIELDLSTSRIEAEIFKLKNSSRGTISDELNDYIHKNFKRVDTNDTAGRKWCRVVRSGNDEKYGSFMVSFDTKEYRGRTFDEFYGGGIVD